jgi:hypothetical protein
MAVRLESVEDMRNKTVYVGKPEEKPERKKRRSL